MRTQSPKVLVSLSLSSLYKETEKNYVETKNSYWNVSEIRKGSQKRPFRGF